MKQCNCAEAHRHMCDNLDQKIDSPACRRIKKHLAGCSNCRAYLDSLKTTVTLYRTLPAPRVPAAAHRKLFLALKTASSTIKRKKVKA
jgi:predicted anti-sigma-YlaC factor YlaD